MYDVAIVGGGPAGATLARLIGRDYRVLLLDKQRLSAPTSRAEAGKCCGGLVAPAAQKVLASMGLGLPEKLLVGADGANSLVRRLVMRGSSGGACEPDKYVAIQEWFAVDHVPPYFSAIFDRRVTDFYSWMIPKANGVIVGAALRPNRDARRRFNLLTDKLRRCGVISGECFKREGGFIYRPRRPGQISTGSAAAALVGEAAGWISPSSGEGFSFAFRSAVELAEALRPGPAGFQRRYTRRCRSMRWAIAVKNARCRLMFTPSVRKIIMQAGLGALPKAHGRSCTAAPLRLAPVS